MEWVEASGKSLLEAQDRVLDLLGVAEDDAEFIVLAEPKPGLFGRMRGEARVQGRVRPVVPPPKRGRRQRSDRPRNEHRPQSGGERKNRQAGGGKGRSGPGREANPPAATSRRPPGGSSTMDGGADDRPREAPASVNRRGGARGFEGTSGGRDPEVERAGSERSANASEVAMQESLTLQEQGEFARAFVAGLITEFGLEAEVGVTELDAETVQVAATGNDLGLLVGPRVDPFCSPRPDQDGRATAIGTADRSDFGGCRGIPGEASDGTASIHSRHR